MPNTVLVEQTYEGRTIKVVLGDITREEVDVIVNAANSSLMGVGGVDGAIHRAGGAALTEACRKLRQTTHPEGIQAGEGVITGAGNLPAQWVAHVVGPVYGSVKNPEGVLASAYRSALERAAEVDARSIAFPAMSTGVYGYPFEDASAIAIRTVLDGARLSDSLREIRFVLFSAGDAERFTRMLEVENKKGDIGDLAR